MQKETTRLATLLSKRDGQMFLFFVLLVLLVHVKVAKAKRTTEKVLVEKERKKVLLRATSISKYEFKNKTIVLLFCSSCE